MHQISENSNVYIIVLKTKNFTFIDGSPLVQPTHLKRCHEIG